MHTELFATLLDIYEGQATARASRPMQALVTFLRPNGEIDQRHVLEALTFAAVVFGISTEADALVKHVQQNAARLRQDIESVAGSTRRH